MIEFTVYGKPEPAGSKRAFTVMRKSGKIGATVSEANPKAASWKSLVIDAARKAYSGPLLRGPLKVAMTFVFPRPQGHLGTGRNAGKLKPNAPAFRITRPDVLKLARGTEDALTGIVWADDSQTVRLVLEKRFGGKASAEIRIQAL